MRTEPTVGQPIAQLLKAFRIPAGVVEDDETGHRRTRNQQLHVIRRSMWGVVVLRYRTAEHDAGTVGQPGESGLQGRATDVVEEDVYTVGRVGLQFRAHVGGLVVDRGVEPDLLDEPAALLLTAGDTDHPAAFDAGDLPDDVANRPGRPGHQHGLALRRLADL